MTTPNNRTRVSVGLYMHPPVAARQQLGKYVPAATENCWKIIFYAVHVVSKENRVSVLPRTSLFYILLIKCQISMPTNKTVIYNIGDNIVTCTGYATNK
jgi:hypothetical protein